MRAVLFGAAFAAFCCFAGCYKAPNEESGPDAYRHQAQDMPLDVWVPDSVSSFDGDQTDWKSFAIGTGGDVIVTVVFDDDTAEGEAALYDKHGMPVASEVKKESDSPRIVLKGAIPSGKNFLRVTAGPKSKAGYTVQVKLAQQRFAAPE